MKSLTESTRETRRQALLRLLLIQPGYRTNSSNLHAGLYAMGLVTSRDEVNTDLHWLRDQGLLRLDEVAEVPGLCVAEITARGEDVAQGHAMVPGVRRPEPR